MIETALRKLGAQRNRILRLSKEGGWIIVGQSVSVVGALVLVRVLTEYLEPAEYGELALGLTVAALVNQVVMGGIASGIARFYSIASEQNDLQGYILDSRKLVLYGTYAVVAIGFAIIVGLLWIDYSQWIGVAAAALMFALLNAYNKSLNGVQNAARQRSIVALHSGMEAWVKIALAVAALAWLGTSSVAVIIGYAAASLIVTISQLQFLRRVIPAPFSGQAESNRHSFIGRMWTYSWPFSVWGVFTWLQQASDRWALKVFASDEWVGLYAVSYQLGYAPIFMLTALATTLIGPILYQHSGDARNAVRNDYVHKVSWRVVYASLLATGCGFLFALAFHKWVFVVLVSENYGEASWMLPWMVLGGGFFASGQLLAVKLESELKTACLIKPKITCGMLGGTLNFVGAYYGGAPGVIASLVVVAILYFSWVSWLGKGVSEQAHRRVAKE